MTSGIGGIKTAAALTGVVYGTTNGTRGAIAGAPVTLKLLTGAIVASVVSDSAGRYRFSNPVNDAGVVARPDIPTGRYLVSARYHSNTAVATVSLSITSTSAKDIDLSVIRIAGSGAPPPPAPNVYYATDRVAATNSSNLKDAFANARIVLPCSPLPDCAMHYGVEHATVFNYGPPQPVSDLHSLVAQIHADYPSASSILVFLHGYNNDFFDAFQLGATIVTGLDPGQPVIVFSWPSNAKALKYLDDETNNTWDADHFRDFLVGLLTDPTAPPKINVLAHSMGNRLAVEALEYLAHSGTTTTGKIGQVILAAPDVDSGTFWESVGLSAGIADGITVYGSSHDEALRASRDLHGHCRAGLMGCDDTVPPLAKLNVIDASLFACDLFGHGYWSASTTMQSDIASVLKGGVMTSDTTRIHLRQTASPNRFAFSSFLDDDTACGAKANDVR